MSDGEMYLKEGGMRRQENRDDKEWDNGQGQEGLAEKTLEQIPEDEGMCQEDIGGNVLGEMPSARSQRWEKVPITMALLAASRPEAGGGWVGQATYLGGPWA